MTSCEGETMETVPLAKYEAERIEHLRTLGKYLAIKRDLDKIRSAIPSLVESILATEYYDE